MNSRAATHTKKLLFITISFELLHGFRFGLPYFVRRIKTYRESFLGSLVTLAMKERRVRIELGYGMEKFI